jgi:hypothetical protein
MINIKNRPQKVEFVKWDIKTIREIVSARNLGNVEEYENLQRCLAMRAKAHDIFSKSAWWKDVARRLEHLAREENLIR